MLNAIQDAAIIAFQPMPMLAVLVGVIIGTVIGALPGLTATMGMALMAPFTFFMPAVVGIAFLIGLYKGGTFGGSITAVLIGTPGTASNAATMLDGYPLAQRGEGSKALSAALWGSVFGDFVGTVALVIGAPLLASFALRFGHPEFFALTVFSLTLVCFVSGDSLAKGLLAASIGIVISMIGVDPLGGGQRMTFGISGLSGGIGVIPLAIGLFGLSEVILQLGQYRPNINTNIKSQTVTIFESIRTVLQYPRTVIRSALIGVGIGALPGVGAETSNWIAYGLAKRASKKPEEFGKGTVEGVIAPEVSANAVCGAAMVPMLIFGIPGDIVTAIMMGALIAQGLNPGPRLIVENQEIFYSLFILSFVAMFFLAFVGYYAIRYAGLILRVSKPILFSAVTVLCIAGAYSINSSLFDVGLMVAFGILGAMMRQIGVPVAPLVLAFILTPIIENSLRRTLVQSEGSLSILIERPISGGLLLITVLLLASLVGGSIRKSAQANKQDE